MTDRLDNKKITKKALVELIGAERIKKMTKEAWETHMKDPYICNDFWLGSKGMLNIEFNF